MRPHLRARAARDAGAVYTLVYVSLLSGGEGCRLLLVDAHGRARANQVPVAVDVVDAADGGPELRVLDVGQREGRRLAAVGAVPAKRIKIEKETTQRLLSWRRVVWMK